VRGDGVAEGRGASRQCRPSDFEIRCAYVPQGSSACAACRFLTKTKHSATSSWPSTTRSISPLSLSVDKKELRSGLDDLKENVVLLLTGEGVVMNKEFLEARGKLFK
jgi:hypothetical protein